jgi:cytoskeletal protein CcmA (bactofilin family)
MWKRRRGPGKSDDLTAFLDQGSEIDGRCVFQGTVLLNGRFTGEIASADILIIGEQGRIKADIRAAHVLVRGELAGRVTATERLELARTARVLGDVESPIIVVEEGACFEGRCQTTRAGKEAEAPPPRDLSVVQLKR